MRVFAEMNMSGVKSYIRFFGFLSTLVGGLFIALGLLGLILAVGDLASSSPIVKSGIVLASVESPSSGSFAIRVRLDDGRQVTLAEEATPINKGVNLRLVVKEGAYEIYNDPIDAWVGSLLCIAIGAGMYLAGRKMKVAWT
jgi:hypothetical protein